MEVKIFKSCRKNSGNNYFETRVWTLKSGSTKMVNKHTVDYHSSPSELTSRVHPFIFLWTPKGFNSSEYFLNFYQRCISYLACKKDWNSWCYDYWKIHLGVCWICSFFSKQNSSPVSYRHHPFPPNIIFWKSILARQKGRRSGLWS